MLILVVPGRESKPVILVTTAISINITLIPYNIRLKIDLSIAESNGFDSNNIFHSIELYVQRNKIRNRNVKGITRWFPKWRPSTLL